MTAYARLSPDALSVERIEDYDPVRYADRAQRAEYARLVRPLVIDPLPAVTAAQAVAPAGYVIEPAQVRSVWAVRDKTAGEIELEAIGAELSDIDARLADLVAQRAIDRTTWDAYNANQLRAEQWRDRQALLRAVHFMLRRIKRGG